ncbi:hypothetical protein B0H14DRAFT_2603206 [Mycena olivaceomarginata]|nr:hypothetical protein B0H14DRAFT_2603206 [Mycena olivaceomarginata]
MDAYSLKLAFLQITFEALSYVPGVFAVVGTITMFHIARRGLRKSLGRQTLMAITMIMLLGATIHLGLHLASIVLGLTPDVVPRFNVPDIKHSASFDSEADLFSERCRRRLAGLGNMEQESHGPNRFSPSVCLRRSLNYNDPAATSLTLYAFNILSMSKGAITKTLTQNFLGTFLSIAHKFRRDRAHRIQTMVLPSQFETIHQPRQPADQGRKHPHLLLESGGLYCVFWILLMVGDFGCFNDFGLEWVQPNVSGIYLTVVVLVVSQRKMLSPEVLAYTSQSVRLESLTGGGTVPATWSAPTPPRRKEGKSFSYPDRVHVVQTREYYSSSPRDSYL